GFPLKDERIKAIDSVFSFYSNNPDVKQVPGAVIRQMRRTLWDRHYRRNSTTMDQLKNAGGLRLIRKNTVRDSIAAYDLLWQRAEFWVERYKGLQEKGKDYLHNIIDANSAVKEYIRQTGAVAVSYYPGDAVTSIHPLQLNAYLNFLYDQKVTTSQDKLAYVYIRETAERLIELIKKEYRLK
ncbi:MAG TPA: hypothetical protein VF476_06310, partial [Chitinophagaceae bacterium]